MAELIENPNQKLARLRAQYPQLIDGEPDDDLLSMAKRQGRIRVKRMMAAKYTDPQRFDEQYASIVREVQTEVVDIDAKLMEAGGRIVHYRNAREFLTSPTVRARVNHALKHRKFLKLSEADADRASDLLRKKSIKARMGARRLREGSDFEYGLYPDEAWSVSGAKKVFPISDIALPSLNSPQSKQQLLVDYLDAHRKSFDAATFNPIAKRIIRLVGQFVLGRGVVGTISDREHQDAWNDFWKRNRMKLRTKQTLRELLIYGEFFWRYFNVPGKGLVVRSIDPSTIWDIVTDDDDLEDVKYYHQQYVKLDISPIPGKAAMPSTLVIRQIPAAEVSHFKINSTSSEKRGRSELFPILGYLLRFKEYVNDRILLNKMRAMFALDVSVEGGDGEVQAAENQFAEPPGPAAVLVHNKAVEVEFKNANTNAGDAATDADTILKIIAIGAGISEQFLGVSRAQTRAGALISTEPDVKNFEEYQELMEEVLIDASDRVFVAAKLSPSVMEFTFPSIAQEDRHAKLQDIAFSESMDYFSKERAATMVAREFQISDYHYSTEQQTIHQERAGEPVMTAALQQVPKIGTGKDGAQAEPGLGSDLKPAPKVTQTSAQMGFSDRIGGRALADTQATLNRSGFTRGGEKTAIRNNRTSGTPLRHSAEAPRKSGWGQAAREKSLAVRRAKAAQKRREP